jgi:hypothetical protein
LTPLTVIPVPIWTPTGATAPSFDLDSFDPVTRILYYADRRNHGALAIDTTTNTLQSIVAPPGCTGTSCPSGVQVIPDLRKLVLTSRQTTIWIYDLTNPSGAPIVVSPVPNGADELDYDPIHQRIYVGNTTAPYFLIGIDLTGPNANTIVASIALPGSPEQPRYNPVDGLVYLTIPSVGVLVIDPNAGGNGTGDIVKTITATDCGPQGNDIDPVTDTILVACTAGTTFRGAELLSLPDGKVLTSWPNANGIDVLHFNRNTRRWYAGAGSSTFNGGNCPSINTGAAFPVLGVYAAPPLGSTANATFVGGQCSGRGGRVAGVDPIGSNVYVAAAQFPADPSSDSTGQTGIVVFNDAAPTQPTPARSQAVLGSNGTVTFTQQGRAMNVFANLQGLNDAPTRLVVTSTVGNEVVPCDEAGGRATCAAALIGDPVLGGVVAIANAGKMLSPGKISAASPLIITDLRLDRTSVAGGGSFTANVVGSNLTSQTFFDVRFSAPGSSAYNTASNWQRGDSNISHSVPSGTPTGTWIISGIRAHQDAADHTGSFTAVSASITVSQ